jgi:DNA repair protein RecO (recombination protein O)
VSRQRERLYRTPAIVLKRRDQGEADRVLTVFTPAMGKRQLLAKGVRKITSRKAGHVELFTHSQFLVAKGQTWDLVTQAETIEGFRPLREDLLRTSYAYYVAELVDRFTQEGDEHHGLFELLLATLGRLAETADLALLARYFELRLLGLVGYRPQLFQCVHCRADMQPVDNFWSRAAGGVLCPRCGEGLAARQPNEDPGVEPLPLTVLKVLRFLQTRDWETCAGLRLSRPVHDQVERLLQGYMVYQLERNLKSVGFLHTVRRLLAHPSP